MASRHCLFAALTLRPFVSRVALRCAAVMDPRRKVIIESILETKAATILEFFAGLRGTLSVTFEEGTWAAWLYDLLKPRVANLVVCNPRKIALLQHGNKATKSMSANWRTMQLLW